MTVKRVVSSSPQVLKVEVEVRRTRWWGRATLPWRAWFAKERQWCTTRSISIKVRPQAGMARVGGINFPKQLQQFEAFAYHNGGDGKPNTKDDLEIGPVDVTWSIEEYTATFDDKDKDYVGTLDANGLFTPNVDGPNPKRPLNGNNVGDVWVVATHKTGGRQAAARARAPAGHDAAIREVRSAGGRAMSELGLREFHAFRGGGGREFAYLVPSAAVFELDDTATAVIARLRDGAVSRAPNCGGVEREVWSRCRRETLRELIGVQAIGETERGARQPEATAAAKLPADDDGPQRDQPVQPELHVLLRVRRGQDRRHGKREAGEVHERGDCAGERGVSAAGIGRQPLAHLTFFGGETLMNFPVLQSTIAYARRRAAEMGKEIDFSLTTNATLLKPDVIEFLAENRVGVTISIDGPKEVQDQFRVFHNGTGSYDIVAPKIRELLRRHRSRPIGARVTLTSQNLDIRKIFRHLRRRSGSGRSGSRR